MFTFLASAIIHSFYYFEAQVVSIRNPAPGCRLQVMGSVVPYL